MQIEEIALKWSGVVSYVGGIGSFVLDSLSTGAVAFMALLVNWYYLRRRDRREQEKHDQDMTMSSTSKPPRKTKSTDTTTKSSTGKPPRK
jgi:hypothetical protein